MYLNKCLKIKRTSHNPYFNRWFSAILKTEDFIKGVNSHNPYFNRWFSAMEEDYYYPIDVDAVTILILIDGFLQSQTMDSPSNKPKKSQSLF